MTLSSTIHVATYGLSSLFLMAEQYSIVYMYVPHLLYPFLCQWTFRLLPCLGCCKQCCSEHQGACIFGALFFSGYTPKSGIARSYGNSIFSFLRNLLTVPHSAAPVYILSNSAGGFPSLHTLFSICCLWIF